MALGKYQEWLTEEGLLKIQGWARDGLTDKQVAAKMGINPDTLYTWIKKYPDISEALKKGKEVVDRGVENGLLKRALGYPFDEVTYGVDESGKKVVSKIVTKQVSPDVTAQIFWLKNRKPKEWRDRKESEFSGTVVNNNPFEGLKTEELRRIARIEKLKAKLEE